MKQIRCSLDARRVFDARDDHDLEQRRQIELQELRCIGDMFEAAARWRQTAAVARAADDRRSRWRRLDLDRQPEFEHSHMLMSVSISRLLCRLQVALPFAFCVVSADAVLIGMSVMSWQLHNGDHR